MKVLVSVFHKSHLTTESIFFNPRPAGCLDFPRHAGGGGDPPAKSAPRHLSEKRKRALESSSEIITKLFRSIFGLGQY